MKAIYLVKNGKPEEAFQIREKEKPVPAAGQVLIKTEAFGLNFADVMARLGLYQDCPPLPAVIGYEVVGTVESIGPSVTQAKVGERVVAFTRFGGYATHAITDERAVAAIPPEMDAGVACALATQYSTAYFAAEECVKLHEGDKVLIHAAAGGVGTALIQLAKLRGCTIFGTAGSAEKMEYLREQGVQYPINYRTTGFASEIKKLGFSKQLDAIFDPVGGKSVKQGIDLLNAGGRMVCYGASEMTDAKGNPFKMLQIALGFGLWSPIPMMMRSFSIIGINMLRIADHRPETLQRCLKEVVALTHAGKLQPTVGASYSADNIAGAHAFLASRQSIGKVVVKW
ncbi:MAG: zinc-binding dehydrogenase [Chitinophagales bacterium]|nr:zinc-binding dehydrogenase [Chitinophagales bacterium]